MPSIAENGRALMGAALASLIVTVFSVSYSALIFQGPLGAGLPTAVWAMMVGAIVVNLAVFWSTCLPPAGAAPAASVTAVFAAMTGILPMQALATPAGAASAVTHIMLALTIATILLGVIMAILGYFRKASLLRFIPYAVVGGFQGGTGILLVLGGARLVLGKPVDWNLLTHAFTADELFKSALAGTFAAGLILARRFTSSSLVLPGAFVLCSSVLAYALSRGVVTGSPQDWFLTAAPRVEPWMPYRAVLDTAIDWQLLVSLTPHYIAAAVVGLVSGIVTVATLELSRATAADLDVEIRDNGFGNIVVGTIGGIASFLSPATCRVVYESGARSRVVALYIAVILALCLLLQINLSGLAPTPIIAGLLIFTGYALFIDTVNAPIAGRRWVELTQMLLFVLIAVRYGFVVAVPLGVIVSCIVFAYSYSRIGVVRRHLTRQLFSGNVEHTVEVERQLREHGDAIHVYWLSGYIFFGSSDGVFERIKKEIEGQKTRPVEFAVLDLAGVPGADASAVMSFTKLKNVCDRQDIVLCYAGTPPDLEKLLERDGLVGGKSRHRLFTDHNAALSWCEDELLRRRGGGTELDTEFERWLTRELGVALSPASELHAYFQRQSVSGGTLLYQQGTPADTIDIVADGIIAILYEDVESRKRNVRRMARRTVVGEMGFFRNQTRTASVLAEGDVVVYTLSRASFERMRAEQPQLAGAFLEFIIRTLADRLEFANKEIAALI